MAYTLIFMELPVHVPEHIPDKTEQFLLFHSKYNGSHVKNQLRQIGLFFNYGPVCQGIHFHVPDFH